VREQVGAQVVSRFPEAKNTE